MRFDLWIMQGAVLCGMGAAAQEGQLDPAFGSNGIASLVVDTTILLENDMFVQDDGSILTTGRCSAELGWDLYVLRCVPDGALDATFGALGFVRTDLGTYWDQAFAITVDGSGRILVAAESFVDPLASRVSVVRYLPDGALDADFGDAGIAYSPATVHGHPRDLIVRDDGAIIVVGCNSAYSAIALYQFTDSGVPDVGFGSGGALTVSPFAGLNMATRVRVQNDGRAVVSCVYGQAGAFDVGVIRFMPNGSYDTSFGNSGKAVLSVSPGDEIASGLGLQSDGRIVIAGSTDHLPNSDMYAARFTPNGVLDTGFASNGIVRVSASAASDGAKDLVIQENDAILLCGGSDQSGGRHIMVVRLMPSGQLDPSFGGDGVVLTPISGEPWVEGTDMALQPDGRVIVAAGGGGPPLLLRYLAGPFIRVEEQMVPAVGMTISPNPVMDQAMLQYVSHSAARSIFELVDDQGRSVRSFFVSPGEIGPCQASLDMSGVASGSYTLVLRSATECGTVRVQKQ